MTTYAYDLLLKAGTVVDPVHHGRKLLDLAVADGRVVEAAPDLSPTKARECIDVGGFFVMPGIVDLHVHASAWLGGQFGHKMMALAGVTTALDMSGPIDSVLDIARDFGVGLNLASIQYVRPGHTVSGTDPGRDELAALLDKSLAQGALGFKILGGHYPLTPEATRRAIEVAHDRGAYVAFHAGTLASGSNIDGFLEAVDLAGDHPLHIAHVNSYCRGGVRPHMVETEEAVAALESHPNICSESYLSPMNGTSAKCAGGRPESNVTRTCLSAGGYPATEKGLAKAIRQGWAQINLASGGRVVFASGGEAVDYWRRMATDTPVSFSINPAEPRIRLATARRAAGGFVVDCISTDGGGIPRNVTVEMGLALVKLQALSLEDFVRKTSRNPARILGLANKGHLGLGADADITVVDLERQQPVLSLSNGRVIMFKGHVCGTGTRMITTPAGEDRVKAAGLQPLVVDPGRAPLCRRPSPES